ncbi:MAG: hypothetical protein A2X18_01610 [Bacteroidetes bacterium GWF2_40_14]|nr:MAG: hypothetical protein A2X18_01610 [Bacteroidetes bacterium GWF2_40_14]
MKKLKKYFTITLLISGILFVSSCSDEIKEKEIDFPNDVTFNAGEGLAIDVPWLTYLVPDAAYKVTAYKYGEVTMNVKKNANGTHTGFALSSKNYRSYPWITSKPRATTPSAAQIQAAVDSSIYSVYSGTYPNQLKNFTVVRVEGDDAFFTIDQPRIVEHVLVANTNYNFQLLNYGSRYSSKLNALTQVYDEYTSGTTYATVRNPNIPDAAPAKFGVWYMSDVYNFGGGQDYIRLAGQQILSKIAAGRAAGIAARAAGKTKAEATADSTAAYTAKVQGYVKLIAKGYLNSTQTGTSEYYLALFPGVAPAPLDLWNTIQGAWAKWDLSGLGTVNKVIFYMDSSDKDANGKMRTPPYFCLDGIRLK